MFTIPTTVFRFAADIWSYSPSSDDCFEGMIKAFGPINPDIIRTLIHLWDVDFESYVQTNKFAQLGTNELKLSVPYPTPF